MIKILQTIFEPPLSNCMQACIASILELSLKNVPNFMESGDDWEKDYDRFLASHGLQQIVLDIQKHWEELPEWRPIGYHMISGKSPRGNFYHEIVGYQGKGVHDPFPGGNCELNTIEYFSVLVCKNPAWVIERPESTETANNP